jgi:predicted alpha/beta superfamily hydrolase
MRWLWAGVAACALVATYAGFRLAKSRDAEREARLRSTRTLTGSVREETFSSPALGGSRRVWVYLPPQYASERERRFPVLYLQDGQNVFDGSTAFIAGSEWGADETAERLSRDGRIEPLIVVGIDNAGERRASEYTPCPNREGEGGGAPEYVRVLAEELKPWIDARYRTLPGRESTGIGGSSLGGLVSLYAGIARPGVFSRVAALSTSAWWGYGCIVGLVDALPGKAHTRVWLDIGTREDAHGLAEVRRLRDALVRKGWSEGADLRYVEVEGGRHHEPAWAKRLPQVLEYLYPPRR